MSEVEEEIFEETATKEPEPKKKKPKKKRVISEAQRKQMLENLRKGRETSKRNRQARGQAKKLIKEKVKRNIDAVLSGKDLVEKEEKVPIEKVATFAKEEIKKQPKYIAKDLTAQEILLQRIEELKQENLTLREKRKIKKEIAKVEKVIEKEVAKEEKKKEVVVVKEEVVNEFTPRRPCGQSAPIPIVHNRPMRNVSTFRRPRW